MQLCSLNTDEDVWTRVETQLELHSIFADLCSCGQDEIGGSL